ncbi:MAG: outer membrane protein assembly factor BamE domain-containing protein, partial [Vicinamibacterales bacterium]
QQIERALAAARPPPVRSVVRPVSPEQLAKWGQLRPGMSRAAVHALLGEPKWRDRSVNTEFWLYVEDTILGRGWVAFYDHNGPVFSWREP